MIDPNIALQGRPVQIETPLEARYGVERLQNLRNVNQLQQGEIQMQPGQLTAQQQEIKARQIALDNQNATNAAIAKHTSFDPQSGKVAVDHSGVVSDLAQSGHGLAAQAYQVHATEIQEGLTRLAEAQSTLAKAHQDHLGSMAQSIIDAPEGARAALYAPAVALAIKNGDAQPGQLPETYDPSILPHLQQIAQQSKTVAQSSEEAIRKGELAANQKRNDILQQKADAYDALVTSRTDAEQWMPNGTRNGQAVYVNRKTGEERVGGPTDMPSPKTNTAQQRANQTEYDKAHKDEQNADQLRQAIGGALQDGNLYVDPKGQVQSFDSLIKKGSDEDDDGYKARRAKLVKGYQAEMKLRLDAVTRQANAATVRKNAALRANGGTPDVSDEQAAAQRGGKPAPASAAPQQQAANTPPPDVIAQMPVNKIITFGNGSKFIKGSDGKVRPAR